MFLSLIDQCSSHTREGGKVSLSFSPPSPLSKNKSFWKNLKTLKSKTNKVMFRVLPWLWTPPVYALCSKNTRLEVCSLERIKQKVSGLRDSKHSQGHGWCMENRKVKWTLLYALCSWWFWEHWKPVPAKQEVSRFSGKPDQHNVKSCAIQWH